LAGLTCLRLVAEDSSAGRTLQHKSAGRSGDAPERSCLVTPNATGSVNLAAAFIDCHREAAVGNSLDGGGIRHTSLVEVQVEFGQRPAELPPNCIPLRSRAVSGPGLSRIGVGNFHSRCARFVLPHFNQDTIS
jgi:hypothetical protein